MRQLIGTTYMLSKLMVLTCGHKETQDCLSRAINQAADSARSAVKRANGYMRIERRDKRTQNA